MRSQMVPIEWGMMTAPTENSYFKLSATLFPYTKRNYMGGCRPDGSQYALIYVCTQCVRTEYQWLNQMAEETLKRKAE